MIKPQSNTEFNNGWYSTFDVVPEYETEVLVYLNGKITIDKRIVSDSYGNKVDRFKKCPTASHWQPLPAHPKSW